MASSLPDVPALTIGLDFSDIYTSFCSLDERGDIVEEGKIKSTPLGLTCRFAEAPAARVVLEVGTHSPWASRLLKDLGHEVFVANPRKVRLIAESIRKTDRSDAETLARLGRVDPTLLSPVTHRDSEAQADLEVIHARQALVAARTLLINHVRGAVKSAGQRLPACDAHAFHKRAAVTLPTELTAALAPVVQSIAELTGQISEMDDRIQELIQVRYPVTKVLQQVPGVGPLISLTYVLTLGDPSRFKSSRQVGPYLGLVPRQRESGERSPQLRISKAGNKYLRQLLVNGAHYILGFRGPDSDLRRWGLVHAPAANWPRSGL